MRTMTGTVRGYWDLFDKQFSFRPNAAKPREKIGSFAKVFGAYAKLIDTNPAKAYNTNSSLQN